jgi:hypothetical protein
MLAAVQLIRNLKQHQKAFTSALGDSRKELLSSKAAILDVCGWVEEAMDKLVSETAARAALTETRMTTVEKQYIRRTNGFHYSNHFEKMLISVVGYKVLEQIEAAKASEIAILQSILSQLTTLRNHYAHTHLNLNEPYPAGLLTIPTPSIMKNHALDALKGLTAIETELKSTGY